MVDLSSHGVTDELGWVITPITLGNLFFLYAN